MSAPLVVVTGTGTGIGKTHFACALTRAWATASGLSIAGVKPIESGVTGDGWGEDASLLGQMSTFHVKRFPPPYMLARAVSPHLAAREAGVALDLGRVARWVEAIRADAGGVVLELPGGLYSPLALSPLRVNADLAIALSPARTILVAPDRLGVLHDVIATLRATTVLSIDAVVLIAPASPDASTGTNADELSGLVRVHSLGRDTIEALAEHPEVVALARSL